MNKKSLNLTKFGFYSVKEIPSNKELELFYREKYFQNNNGSYQSNYSDDEKSFIRTKILQKLYLCIEHLNKIKGSFLDVGCGEGFSLDVLKNNGWDVSGIDYSLHGAEAHNPDCCKYIELGDFNHIADNFINKKKTFDLIWATNVLEHAREPDIMLKKFKNLLSPDGIIAITVPNDFSELQELFLDKKLVKNPYWIVPPEHLHYFTATSLKKYVKESGFIFRDLIADFPIDWFIANEASNFIKDRSLGKSSHDARVLIENLIGTKSPNEANKFYRELANIGLGRNITIFFSS